MTRSSSIRFSSAAGAWVFLAMTCICMQAFGIQNRAAQNQAPAQAQAQGQNAAPPTFNILARVNGEPVMRQQVATACVKRFGEQVLESIVNKQLVLDECRRRGVMITEQDVIDEIRKAAEEFGMSVDRYINLVNSRRSISEDQLKNEHWHKLALRRLAEKELTVTDQEIEEQFQFEFGPQIQVRQLAVDSAELAQNLAAQAQANPVDFERLVKTHSLDVQSASMGGLLRPIGRHSGSPEFEQVAFQLQPNQISAPFQVGDKFIVLKCERIQPAVALTPEQEVEIRTKLVEEISKQKLTDVAADLFILLQERVKIVNVMNDPELSKQMPGVAAMVDQSRITLNMVAEESIARFGRDILEVEIMKTVMIQELKKNGMTVEPADINAEIGRVADEMGFLKPDGSPDVEGWLSFTTEGDNSKVEFYLDDEVWPSAAMRKLVQNSVSVTAEDLKKGFESNYGPRVEVLAIMFTDQRQAQRVWKMAINNPKLKYFGELANTYSIDPMSQTNFGEVPPIGMHGGRPELEREAFGLQPGEISKVTQVGEHFVVMFCKGMTQPRVTEFEAVKDLLHKNIFEKKLRIAMTSYYHNARDSAQIDNFLAGTSQTGAAEIRSARAVEAEQRHNR